MCLDVSCALLCGVALVMLVRSARRCVSGTEHAYACNCFYGCVLSVLCLSHRWVQLCRLFHGAAISPATRSLLGKIPLLTVKAGPRDGDKWTERLKEEYSRLIEFIKINKETDTDWFTIESNKTGTRWTGKCWYFHDSVRHEFDLQFEIPVTYPTTPIEMLLPELDGKTRYGPDSPPLGKCVCMTLSELVGCRCPTVRSALPVSSLSD